AVLHDDHEERQRTSSAPGDPGNARATSSGSAAGTTWPTRPRAGSPGRRAEHLAPGLRELRERDEADRAVVQVVAERRECAEERGDRAALGRVDRARMAHDRDRAPRARHLSLWREVRQVPADDRLDRALVVAVGITA